MCLQCRTPTQEELSQLDSWDLAFLTATGHVEWMDTFDASFFAMKALEGHGAKEYLWGPQADLMIKAIVGAYNRVGRKYTDEIVAAFDRTGDISVHRGKMAKALRRSEKMGREMWLACGGKIRTVLEETIEASKRHFNRQRRQALKQVTQENWEAYLAAAEADHVAAYMQQYPGRILHPEVDRLVKIAETSPRSRPIDLGQLDERIGKIHDRGENYFNNLSDVQVGRTWTHSGLQLAMEQNVTEYMIVAEGDRRTCPVCRTLHGRRFSVPAVHAQTEATLALTDASEIAQAAPFPRLNQLDNQSREAIRAMDLAPPFHGRCRCDVVFLWSEVGVEIPADPELTKFGDGLLKAATKAEPGTTKVLQGVAEEYGARMEGLDFRIKARKSMLRKMRNEMADNPAWKLADLAQEDVNDVLRYTMMSTDYTYTSTVTKTLRRLKSEEHQILRMRNYWTKDGYKGVNCVMKNPQGVKYELQFHTPKSLDVKERISHPLYEKLRVTRDPDEIAALEKKIADAWRSVPKPTGVHQLDLDVIDLTDIYTAKDMRKLGASLRHTALVNEKPTTALLKRVAEQEGAQMEGLSFRIKSSKSTLRKMRNELADNPAWDLADMAREDVNDILRFTMLADEGAYAKTVTNSLNQLKRENHQILKVKNYWSKDGYKGVNCVIKDPNGIKYELQFHTPESFYVKEMYSHPLYERLRVSTDIDEIFSLEKQIVDVWKPVRAPRGIETVTGEAFDAIPLYTLEDIKIRGARLVDLAKLDEEVTTAMLNRYAKEAGGSLEGLEFRIKSNKSLYRKMRTELRENPSWTIDDLVKENLNDVLRFTMVVDDGVYTNTVVRTLDRLQRDEVQRVVKVKNYWTKDGYRGVNVVMKSDTGQKYELQFHTPKSLDVKERVSHPLYEKLRTTTDPEEIAVLEKKIADAWGSVDLPKGIERVSLDDLDDLALRTYVTPNGIVEPDVQAWFEEALAAMPDDVLRELRKDEYQFYLPEYISKIRPDLTDVTPRGWPAGTTWDMAEGYHSAARKEIVVSQRYLDPYLKGSPPPPIPGTVPAHPPLPGYKATSRSRTFYVAYHEAGHALDEALGAVGPLDWKFPISNSKEFKAAYTKDLKAIDALPAPVRKKTKDRYSYFLQAAGDFEAGRSEAVAEMLTEWAGHSNHKMAETFPNSYKVFLKKTGLKPKKPPKVQKPRGSRGYKKASTVEEAVKLAEEKLGVRWVGGGEYPDLPDLEVMNEYNKALFDSGLTGKQLARVGTRLRAGGQAGINIVEGKTQWDVVICRKPLDVVPKVTDTIDVLPDSLEKYYKKDLTYNMSAIRRKVSRGSSVRNTYDIAMHEFGHVATLQDTLFVPHGFADWGEIEDAFTAWVKSDQTKLFSGYAGKNYSEALAEAFVELKRGTYRKGMLPDFLENFLFQAVRQLDPSGLKDWYTTARWL